MKKKSTYHTKTKENYKKIARYEKEIQKTPEGNEKQKQKEHSTWFENYAMLLRKPTQRKCKKKKRKHEVRGKKRRKEKPAEMHSSG